MSRTLAFSSSVPTGYSKLSGGPRASVREIGGKSLYRRGRVWLSADTAHLDLAKDASQIKIIQRFSEEYFKLIRVNTVAENQILASQQEGESLIPMREFRKELRSKM